MLRRVLISDFNDGGVELVFVWRTLRSVRAGFLDVLFLDDCWRFLLLDYLNDWLLVLLRMLLELGWTVCVGLHALGADLLNLLSLFDGFIIGETFLVGCQGVKREVILKVHRLYRNFWCSRNDDRKWLFFDQVMEIARGAFLCLTS